jgi:hypothetical protein
MMRTDLKKRLKKSPLYSYLIETKEKITNNSEVMEVLANVNNHTYMKTLENQGYPPH